MKFVLDIRPGDAAINSRYEVNRNGTLRLSAAYRTAVEIMTLQVRQEMVKGRRSKIASGHVSVTIDVYWPTPYSQANPRAKGDVDAPIKAVLDALQHGGAYDTDNRVIEVLAVKHVDRIRPRIEVEVRTVTE